MLTANECLKRYGPPEKEAAMRLWTVPDAFHIPVIPRRIYCNKDMIGPLTVAFTYLIQRGLTEEIRTWDGCFNIRKKRGGRSPSLHSFGCAIDLNAAWNPFGRKGTMNPEIVKCFKEAGFDWGGDWTTPDFMHFQLKRLPPL